MKNILNKVGTMIVFSMFLLGSPFIGGCGDSESGKAITDTLKKVIGDEVAKQGNEVKKQIDQVINVGSNKDKKEGEKSSAQGSEKESKEGSSEEKD